MLIVIFLTVIISIVSAVYSPIWVGVLIFLFGTGLFIYKRKEYKLFFFLTVVFCLFFFYTSLVIHNKEISRMAISKMHKNVSIEGKVTNTFNYGFLIKVKDAQVLSGKQLLVFRKSHDLILGDVVRVDGNLSTEENLRRIDLLTRPLASVFPRQLIKLKDSNLTWIFKLKAQLISNVKKQLPEYYANFLIGLLIGVNGIDLDSDLQDVFLNLGLLHMLVVSGAQVALLTSVLLGFLAVFNLPKLVNFIIVLSFNCIFLLFVGGELSVLRAVIMMQITLFLNYDHRSKTSLQVLALTGIIMLCFAPGTLFSLSFILSFFATFAVVEVSPLIQKMLENNEYIPALVKEPLGVSLGPILITSPIIFLINGRFDVLALFANMLFAPFVEVVVIMGFLGMILSIPVWFLAIPILKLTFGLMVVMKTVADVLYAFPWRSVYFRHAFFVNVAVYYLFFFTWLYKRELFRKYWFSWLTILVVVVSMNFWFLSQQPEQELFFYNRKDWFSVLYINKDKTVLIVSGEDKEKQRVFLKKIRQQRPDIVIDLQATEDKDSVLAMNAYKLLTFGTVKVKKDQDVVFFQDKEVKVTIVIHGEPIGNVSGVLYLPNKNKVNKKILASGADLILLPCKDSKEQIVSTKLGLIGIYSKKANYHIYQAI